MKNAYERFVEEICNNCKNRKDCIEELRQKLDGSIVCDLYERESKPKKKKKQYIGITAEQSKPLMKGLV